MASHRPRRCPAGDRSGWRRRRPSTVEPGVAPSSRRRGRAPRRRAAPYASRVTPPPAVRRWSPAGPAGATQPVTVDRRPAPVVASLTAGHQLRRRAGRRCAAPARSAAAALAVGSCARGAPLQRGERSSCRGAAADGDDEREAEAASVRGVAAGGSRRGPGRRARSGRRRRCSPPRRRGHRARRAPSCGWARSSASTASSSSARRRSTNAASERVAIGERPPGPRHGRPGRACPRSTWPNTADERRLVERVDLVDRSAARPPRQLPR